MSASIEPGSSENRARWRRMLSEGIVIVSSILLAFGIDAWWGAHRERLREAALLADLLSELEVSRDDLVRRLEGAERMARGNAALRDLVATTTAGGSVEVPDSLILAVIGGPTYEPSANALEAALASGHLEVIRSDEIRVELANWRRIGIDTREDELLVREITNEQVVPLLADEIHLGTYFERVVPWFFGEPADDVAGFATLRGSTQLSGALSLRSFYADFSASDLAEMSQSLERLIDLIETELDS